MIVRARTVVTMDGAPIENVAVVVSGNQIDDSPSGSSPSRAARLCRSAPAGSVVDVGKFDELKTRNAGQVVDLGEQALLPGLINAHCHLDYTCLRGKIPSQKTFADWIRAINAEKAKLSPKDYLLSINEGFAEAKRFGTTAIANLTAFPELVSQITSPIRTWWFAELIDVRAPERANETPLELFLGASGGRGLPRWIVAHLNEIAESDFELLERSKRQFHAVHSPRSHAYFKHSRFPFERLHSLGFNICLGTDSLASNEDLSLFAEMRAFQRREPAISPEEIVKMVTINPAMALHQEKMIGRIRPGFCADLIAVQCSEGDKPFEQIVGFDGSIDWIMVNGKM